MRTVGTPGNEVCVLDYQSKDSAAAALKITYLHNGSRCKAVPYSLVSFGQCVNPTGTLETKSYPFARLLFINSHLHQKK